MDGALSLISFDGLVLTLQRMQAHIAAQDARISELTSDVTSLKRLREDTNGLATDMLTVQKDVRRLLDFTQLTEGIVVPPLNSVLTSMSARIVSLEHNEQERRADSRRFDERIEELDAKYAGIIAGLRDNTASKSALTALQASNEALTVNQNLMNAMIANKIDRSEIHSVQSLVAEVETYAEWRESAINDIRALQATTRNTISTCDATDTAVAGLAEVLQAVRDEQRQKANHVDLEALKETVRQTQAVMETKASVAAMQRVIDSIAQTDARADSIEAFTQRLEDSFRGFMVQTERSFSTVSAQTRQELQTSHDGITQLVKALHSDVNSRAFVTSLEATDENVTVLTESLRSLSSKVDVCLRFVEWFADKGEAYQYNAQALEKHMNALAVGNRGRVGGPPETADSSLSSTAYKPFRMAPYAPASVASLSSGAPTTAGGGVSGVNAAMSGPLTGQAGVRIGGITTAPSATSSATT